MNYTETQLEAIRLFGKKDLSFGCIVYADKGVTQKLPLIGTSCIIGVTSDEGEIDTIETYMKPYNDYEGSSWNDSLSGFMSTYTILGHIPHLLPDVARVAKEKGFKIKTYYTNQGDYIVNVYGIIGKYLEDYEIIYNPTLPLLDQPNLSDIISLFR